MAKVVVSGTLAIDYLGRYPGRFAERPRDTDLNFTVQLDAVERALGGCALNICYSLKLLGDEPLPVATTGIEFDTDYKPHLEGLGIETEGIRVLADRTSAHAFLITDADGNQFTGFYPGPTDEGDVLAQLETMLEGAVDLVVLAPDVPAKMIRQARWLKERDIPVLTDPGQGLSDFTAAEMDALIAASSCLVVNRFEWRMLIDGLGCAEADLFARLDWTVVTQGRRGALWRDRNGTRLEVPAVPARSEIDPTGCGDAFRAGLIHGLARHAPMRDALRCAVTIATLNLECHGTQSHTFETLMARYREAWGEPPDWLGAC